MPSNRLRVGVIGADTKASWAGVSHIPAIRGLDMLTLSAVATRREESAREAAAAFGAEQWFVDPFALIRSDTVDVVTIAVRVPAHRDLVRAALDMRQGRLLRSAAGGLALGDAGTGVRRHLPALCCRAAGPPQPHGAARGAADRRRRDRPTAQRTGRLHLVGLRAGHRLALRVLRKGGGRSQPADHHHAATHSTSSRRCWAT